jgi:ribA/ribD-fused uncharacterized protein
MTITKLTGKLEVLKNSYPSSIYIDGIWYHTVEHAYQAAKTQDQLIKNDIACAETVAEARAIGKKLGFPNNYDKYEVMLALLRKKFYTYDNYADVLVSTGDEAILIESNNTYWGVKFNPKTNTYYGYNTLGVILMNIRQEISNIISSKSKNNTDKDYQDQASLENRDVESDLLNVLNDTSNDVISIDLAESITDLISYINNPDIISYLPDKESEELECLLERVEIETAKSAIKAGF